uniref:Rop family plasmid primer RNA-binding protein n=1 Tax=Klebsiella pneumoniae TaxID=573 RepID=UPI001F4AD8E9
FWPLLKNTQKNALKWVNFSQLQLLPWGGELYALCRDVVADLCEKPHDDAEHLFRTLSSGLDALQDGN